VQVGQEIIDIAIHRVQSMLGRGVERAAQIVRDDDLPAIADGQGRLPGRPCIDRDGAGPPALRWAQS
jgi:hypothetical protein